MVLTEEWPMRLQGLHHVTMITGEARRITDFYAEVLGLRLVREGARHGDLSACRLDFADEHGSPGAILAWIELVGVGQGRLGPGMVHTLELGVRDSFAIDFWARRLTARAVAIERQETWIHFADPDGLALRLVIDPNDLPLRATHPEIPREHAIEGIVGARALARSEVDAAHRLFTDTLGFEALGAGEYRLRGRDRTVRWGYDLAADPGAIGAGSVHHIAWESRGDEHGAWRERLSSAGVTVTPLGGPVQEIEFRDHHGVLLGLTATPAGAEIDGELNAVEAPYEATPAQADGSTGPSRDETDLASRTRNNPEAHRYEILVDGTVAGYTEYTEIHGPRILLSHTEVLAGYEGRGLAGEMTRAVLDDARDRGLAIVPVCAFVNGYVRRHREYVPYLDERLQGTFR